MAVWPRKHLRRIGGGNMSNAESGEPTEVDYSNDQSDEPSEEDWAKAREYLDGEAESLKEKLLARMRLLPGSGIKELLQAVHEKQKEKQNSSE